GRQNGTAIGLCCVTNRVQRRFLLAAVDEEKGLNAFQLFGCGALEVVRHARHLLKGKIQMLTRQGQLHETLLQELAGTIPPHNLTPVSSAVAASGSDNCSRRFTT